jgi:hypothetical protein
MNWELMKERGRFVYARVAEFVVFLQIVFYLWACAVAGKPLGPTDYVSFTYHCVEWKPGHVAATPVADLTER